MTIKSLQEPSSQDEMDISALIERWARAVREENRAGIRADHDSQMLMFDVPPPFLSRGLDAYMATWETFLSWSEKLVAFDFHDVKISAAKDVASLMVGGALFMSIIRCRQSGCHNRLMKWTSLTGGETG
jgi:ketosteroid isomerase-like protein